MTEASPLGSIAGATLEPILNGIAHWLGDQITYAWGLFMDFSGDICLTSALICGLLAMFGSRKAAKGIYWSGAFYIIINILGMVTGS